MADNQVTTIFIAEDHEITRLGLKLTLEQIEGFQVIGEAADGVTAASQVLELKPDIVLMDIGLPQEDGIQATKQIKDKLPDTKVIVLTSHDNDEDIFAALGAGADGYCLKEVPSSRLSLAIQTVADGAAWLDPGIASRVLRACTVGTSGQDNARMGNLNSALSKRELEVLKLVVEGLSNQEIAERLQLSIETVKTHMRHIMEKLAVTDRTQAAVKAMRQGLV